jgi:hypothetical protein
VRRLTDVAAGAGIGILCTKTAYWLYPKCKKLFKKGNKTSVMIAPFITEKKRELSRSILMFQEIFISSVSMIRLNNSKHYKTSRYFLDTLCSRKTLPKTSLDKLK